VGTLIDRRYELEALPIGRGGMGEVWLGHDIRLDRQVAVKFIRLPGDGSDQDYIRRFVRESRITARLEHPGVPAVYDAGMHEGKPYLVMQRIRGISISDLIAEQGALPVGWAAAIGAQVCAVLAVAHQASLVHRDLKPSNLMLEPDGGVKVLDFGLAVAPTLSDFSKITLTGQPLGTPAYMAPEQIQANISGPATDLYALGCTLHEMLTGERLFSGSTSYDVMSKQVSRSPVPVSSVRQDVPAGLEELILHLLRKNPEERPADAQAVFERLRPYAHGLGPWAGVLDPPSAISPNRMYAAVLSRVLPGTQIEDPSATVPLTGRSAPAEGQRPVSGGDVSRARTEARRLAGASRYGQAAEVLSSVVGRVGDSLGDRDEEVVHARLELADILFEEGAYRDAAPAYEQIAAEVAKRSGAQAEPALRARLKGATCRALIGETAEALRQLQELLGDYRTAFGDGDARTVELRQQIGLLQLGAGQPAAAGETLLRLLADLTDQRGAHHPTVAELRTLIQSLPPAARPPVR